MKNGRAITLSVAVCLLASLGCLANAAPRRAAAPARRPRPAKVSDTPGKTRPMTLEEARVAVAMLDDAYHLILETTHATYHTSPNLPVAANVVRRLQTRMEELGWPQSRFLGVNAIVMHPDHTPRDRFEREAVQTLEDKDQRIEQVVEGRLRVATVVQLGRGCSSCHWTPPGEKGKAAISWNIPLR